MDTNTTDFHGLNQCLSVLIRENPCAVQNLNSSVESLYMLDTGFWASSIEYLASSIEFSILYNYNRSETGKFRVFSRISVDIEKESC